MKKQIFLIFLGIMIIAGTTYSMTTEMEKMSGDLKVKIAMDMMKHDENSKASAGNVHHHAMGENTLNIMLADLQGNPVTDAKMKIDYSMAPSNNMPPMKYTARAKPDSNSYKAELNFSMKGDWDILIYIKRSGKGMEKVDFRIHVM